jgi:hypothetical protein
VLFANRVEGSGSQMRRQRRLFGLLSPSLVWLLLPLLAACAGAGTENGSGSADGADKAGSGGSADTAWFVERTADTGIDFSYRGGGTGDLHTPEITGGGVALFDADADGKLDIYLVNGGHNPIDGQPDPTQTNRLFLNRGDWRFEDATDSSGLGDPGYAFGVGVGDADNDGDPDVFLTQYGPDRLYINEGGGRYRDATEAAGIDVGGWSAGVAFVDYDRDGDLDLFIVRYIEFHTELPCMDSVGHKDFCGPQSFPPMDDVLLRNDGAGHFEDVTEEAGIAGHPGPGLGVAAADFDGDGWIDIYVTNDGTPNFLWRNLGDGRFEEIGVRSGAAFNGMGHTEAGMGVVAEDFDQDGWIDLFMTHLRNETNTLYRNLGGARGFLDSTSTGFPGAPSQAFTGFGLVALDLELDADLDLVVANGGVRLGSAAMSEDYSAESELEPPLDRFVEPNQVYVNDGSGTFALLDEAECGLCDRYEITRGMAVGDLDGDGDEDLVLTNIEDPARVYENRSQGGHWLGLKIYDPVLGREAIGAQVSVALADRTLVRTVGATKGYVSSSDTRIVLGLGSAERVGTVRVLWPDGDSVAEIFVVDCVDCDVELKRGEGKRE